MAISWIQKIRLGLRGWSRRQEEQRVARDRDFMTRNAGWATENTATAALQPAAARAVTAGNFDLEGLQIAFLDDSGQMEHYLDLQSGDVVEFRISDAAVQAASRDPHLKRIPRRSADSDRRDCATFIERIEDLDLRATLVEALESEEPLASFRSAVAASRAAERAWYNFKNERAYEVIEQWVLSLTP